MVGKVVFRDRSRMNYISELFVRDQHICLGKWWRCRIPEMGWNQNDRPWMAWVSWMKQCILVRAGKAQDVKIVFKYVISCRIQCRKFREMLLIFQCTSFYMKYTFCVCKAHFQELTEFWGWDISISALSLNISLHHKYHMFQYIMEDR